MAEKNYNAQFETLPSVGSAIGNGYKEITDTRIAFRERIAHEHRFDYAKQDEQGLHKEGSAVLWVYSGDATNAVPATRGDGGTALTTADKGFIAYHAARKALYVWDGTAWLDAREIGAGKFDTITEKTTDGGVTIEGTKFEDKIIGAESRKTIDIDYARLTEFVSASANSSFKDDRLKVRYLNVYQGRPASPVAGDIWIE